MADKTLDLSKPDAALSVTRRGLLLRDSVVFLTLLAITGALYGVTDFLFRSFESHRQDLAQQWASEGRAALEHHQPDTAVAAFRAALSYAPDEHSYQLRLAQALADSGHVEEATNYFLNLWTARPGDGFINLELARLARKRGQADEAVDYYRAATFGDWQGDGLERRRQTRLELADYLTQRGNLPAARNVLLVIAGNAPENAPINLLIADKLLAINDPQDALTYYERAMADDPRSFLAIAKAGFAAYQIGDYDTAHSLLNRAQRLRHEPGTETQDPNVEQRVTELSHDSERMLELTMSRDLPAAERARHIRLASGIAEARLKSCVLQATPPGAPPALPQLSQRWKTAAAIRSADLANNATAQDSVMQLVFETELQTASVCGPPKPGDDDLLLSLARKAQTQTVTGTTP